MSLLGVRQLKALFVLGWALLKHLLASPFRRRLPGLWLDRLQQESLAVVPEHAWELFEGASRCIGCGACDFVGAPGEPVSDWLLGVAREPADAPLASAELDRLAVLAASIERICPARVDVTAFVTLVRANARLLEKA